MLSRYFLSYLSFPLPAVILAVGSSRLSLSLAAVAGVQVDRKAAHELAAHYGLVTQSFDLEPKRYVSVIKQKVCRYGENDRIRSFSGIGGGILLKYGTWML